MCLQLINMYAGYYLLMGFINNLEELSNEALYNTILTVNVCEQSGLSGDSVLITPAIGLIATQI